jgi:DNA-binding response OmpR family regulator
MPGLDGLELIRRINQSGKSRVAVIVLTGREGEDARVGGLDLGADDYIVKPCTARELIARIRAVWRRVGPASRILTLGSLTVDPAAHQVYISGRRVEVTATEFALLLTLMEHAGEVVRTNTIMKQVWDFPVSHDLLRMTVYRLRRKIEPDPKNPRYIHTAQGVGFIMRDNSRQEPGDY